MAREIDRDRLLAELEVRGYRNVLRYTAGEGDWEDAGPLVHAAG